MSNKSKLILAVIAIAVAFAAGRFTTPERVKIQKEIVEVEKKTKDTSTEAERSKRKETTVREVIHPDGTKETITTIIEDSDTRKKSDTRETQEVARKETETKEVEKSKGKLTLSALAGSKVSLSEGVSPLIYGGHISKEVLGPVSLGVFGLSNGIAGVSIGLSF
jgi:membrane glycosyltransferase